MPVLDLFVSADLDNVSRIRAGPDFTWSFMFRCSNCGEETSKFVMFHKQDQVDLVRGGAVNLQLKCKMCKRENDISILDTVEHQYTQENSGSALFAQLECRGAEPTTWDYSADEMTIEGAQGYPFPDAKIEQGEFYGYDEDLSQEASVTEFKYEIKKSKSKAK